MADHWIQGAIKHPGRMKRAAAKAGMSTHEYEEKHKGDSGSLGRAAALGLRLTKMAKKRADGGHVIHGEGEAPKHGAHKKRRE